MRSYGGSTAEVWNRHDKYAKASINILGPLSGTLFLSNFAKFPVEGG